MLRFMLAMCLFVVGYVQADSQVLYSKEVGSSAQRLELRQTVGDGGFYVVGDVTHSDDSTRFMAGGGYDLGLFATEILASDKDYRAYVYGDMRIDTYIPLVFRGGFYHQNTFDNDDKRVGNLSYLGIPLGNTFTLGGYVDVPDIDGDLDNTDYGLYIKADFW